MDEYLLIPGPGNEVFGKPLGAKTFILTDGDQSVYSIKIDRMHPKIYTCKAPYTAFLPVIDYVLKRGGSVYERASEKFRHRKYLPSEKEPYLGFASGPIEHSFVNSAFGGSSIDPYNLGKDPFLLGEPLLDHIYKGVGVFALADEHLKNIRGSATYREWRQKWSTPPKNYSLADRIIAYQFENHNFSMPHIARIVAEIDEFVHQFHLNFFTVKAVNKVVNSLLENAETINLENI